MTWSVGVLSSILELAALCLGLQLFPALNHVVQLECLVCFLPSPSLRLGHQGTSAPVNLQRFDGLFNDGRTLHDVKLCDD